MNNINYIKLRPGTNPLAIEMTLSDVQGACPEAYEISAEQYRKEMFGTPQTSNTHLIAGGDK